MAFCFVLDLFTLLYLMCVGILPALCTMCFPGAHRGHKRVSDHLKLELQTVVSCCGGVGDQIQVL